MSVGGVPELLQAPAEELNLEVAPEIAARSPLALISRTLDVFLSIPLLLLGIGIGAACSVRGCAGGLIKPGLSTIIFLIALATWPTIARLVRGQVLSLREREFVEASRALGASNM